MDNLPRNLMFALAACFLTFAIIQATRGNVLMATSFLAIALVDAFIARRMPSTGADG